MMEKGGLCPISEQTLEESPKKLTGASGGRYSPKIPEDELSLLEETQLLFTVESIEPPKREASYDEEVYSASSLQRLRAEVEAHS